MNRSNYINCHNSIKVFVCVWFVTWRNGRTFQHIPYITMVKYRRSSISFNYFKLNVPWPPWIANIFINVSFCLKIIVSKPCDVTYYCVLIKDGRRKFDSNIYFIDYYVFCIGKVYYLKEIYWLLMVNICITFG